MSDPTPSVQDHNSNGPLAKEEPKDAEETTMHLGTDLEKDPMPSAGEAPYSVFSTTDKWICLLLASSASIFSTMGAPIYYPALTIIESYFHVSEEMVNLSIVLYLSAQAISPTLFAGFADAYGRRPVFIICFVIFIAANIGLALVDNYNALLVLRIIQSFGISPTISIVNGLLGDITERKERAGYVGIASGLRNTGQAFGSLLGAGLVSWFGWRGIFWFLAIAGFISFSAVLALLPETKRSIVGNGSITPKQIWNRAPVLYWGHYVRKWRLDRPRYDTLGEKSNIDFRQGLKILLVPELFVMLLNQALHYSLFCVCLTTLTTQLAKSYHYSVVKIGLCYLPCGFGGLIGAYVSGAVNNWNYKRRMDTFKQGQKDGTISSSKKFDIITTRLETGIPMNIASNLFALMFGWCINFKKNIALINVSTFWVCFLSMAISAIVSTILVDLYPSKGSGATSAMNLMRCGTAAIFIAVLSKMNQVMGVGGTVTFVSGICLLSNATLIYPIKYAMKNAEVRNKKEQEKQKE
ncbi:hypothetical protein WICPIJ_008523 [Wickerhamomyces pijperi]|uniref:Major facilitator superfamily (MFS) profile domain-containing protein n=1 Tax=Wickerhamomyces pijperi TaxID=599730 RepID=A0A9P8TI84_WICPI|nr:hypothetical protein WICPIJ_008523 [Wickerhamomyces pijperi]